MFLSVFTVSAPSEFIVTRSCKAARSSLRSDSVMGRRTSPANTRRKAPKAVPDASRSKAGRAKEVGDGSTDSQKLHFVLLPGCTCCPLHGRIRFELGCRALTALLQNLYRFPCHTCTEVALCRPRSLSVRGISALSQALRLSLWLSSMPCSRVASRLSPKPSDGEFEDLQSELQATEASVDADQELYCLRQRGSRSISCYGHFATLQGLLCAEFL